MSYIEYSYSDEFPKHLVHFSHFQIAFPRTVANFVMNFVAKFIMIHIVREAEVILPTFSRDKSILLLNCPLHA